MTDRVTPVDDVLRVSAKTWTQDGLNFEVTDFERLKESDEVVVDLRVSGRTGLFFDDRVRLRNPPLWTPDPSKPVDQQLRDEVKGRDQHPGYVLDPLLATKVSLLQTVRNVTKEFTRPRIERIERGDRFLGDTLSVRAGSGDGYISSGTAASWSGCMGGVSLSANTTATNNFGPLATLSGADYTAYQSFFGFDTNVGAGATVSAATFTLYGETTAEQNTNSLTMQARLFDWGASLTTADWRNQTNFSACSLFATLAVGSWVQTNNTANAFTSDGGAPALVVKTGTTYLVLGMSNMVTGGSAPTGTNSVQHYFADNSGTTSDPLLDVTYTPGSSGSVSLLMLLGVG